jgi:DNA modification methylase
VTRQPEYRDGGVRLYCGDAADVLGEMPDESVNCLVTSPPYWGLRDYRIAGQYGLEPTIDGYVANLRRVFRDARRVLARDGTLWLNLGDCYGGSWHNYVAPGSTAPTATNDQRGRRGRHRPPQASQRYKSLQGVPWRVAFVLVEDGWILRNAIVWHKPNGRPESARDRLTSRYEMLFLLVSSPRYWFDLDALRGPDGGPGAARDGARSHADCHSPRSKGCTCSASSSGAGSGRGESSRPCRRAGRVARRNPGDVWTIPTGRHRGAHAAVGPVELARRCIAAGCKPAGVVCDPFSGAATTGLAALDLHRRYIGIELNPAFNTEAIQRLKRHHMRGRRPSHSEGTDGEENR